MCNADGENMSIKDNVIPTPQHPDYYTPDILARYPGYTWHLPYNKDDPNFDEGLTILTPSPTTLIRSKTVWYKNISHTKGQVS